MREEGSIVKIVGIAAAVIGIFFIVALIFAGALGGSNVISRPTDLGMAGATFGSGGPVIGLERRSCAGVRAVLSNIPQEYVAFIAQAADRWLSGDQAKLIAVIQFESGFDRLNMSSTGAVGIGQFIKTTAQQQTSFQGSTIYTVEPRNGPLIVGTSVHSLTESDKQTFRQNRPDDGRFDAQRSINAVAELLHTGFQIAADKDGRPGDFKWVYAVHYNGEKGDKKFQNADKMLAVYNKVTTQDCKS